MTRRYDFLVIGSGISGLSYALKVAPYGKVCVMCKANMNETATSYAQGGIAIVMNKNDSYEKHIQDTLATGDGLCDRKVVEMVISQGPERIKELIQWGADFDKKINGDFDLAKEGGHSEYRVLHHKDNTGYEIQRVLSARVRQHENIEIFENYFAIDILTQHHLGRKITRNDTDIECYGVYALNLKTNAIEKFLAKLTCLATGGTGNLYQTTTNPEISTGDGIAMVYRAKGLIENMEFMQFHPTSLYNPGEQPSFLITEALRGFGAKLRNRKGEEFMYKYAPQRELAPRDIVARAIDNEMKQQGEDYVYLDCTDLNPEELKKRFPTIYQKCLSLNIDITRDYIPVVPAAHYLCGGIKVDMNACTWIKNLYAIGEVSCTGLHGANRLASNSLLEAIVYAHNAAIHSIKLVNNISFNEKIPDWDKSGTSHPEEMILITQNYKEMQQIMTNYVGIVRSNLRLERALRRLNIIYQETEELYRKSFLSQKLCELRNLINVGYLIIKMAQNRKESRGLHYNINYPLKNTPKSQSP